MTHDEIIAVVEAHRQGKAIQYRSRFAEDGSKWVDCGNHKLEHGQHPIPGFDFSKLEYRTKPEPREWWILPGFSGRTANLMPVGGDHDASAEWLNYIHVREVLE